MITWQKQGANALSYHCLWFIDSYLILSHCLCVFVCVYMFALPHLCGYHHISQWWLSLCFTLNDNTLCFIDRGSCNFKYILRWCDPCWDFVLKFVVRFPSWHTVFHIVHIAWNGIRFPYTVNLITFNNLNWESKWNRFI